MLKSSFAQWAAIGIALVAPVTAEVKLSERLTKIARHLGEGGAHFSVTDSKGDLQSLGQLIDKVAHAVPEKIPADLKVETLFGDLGLYSLEGRGSSSQQLGKLWHNRTFALTDGQHRGVFSLLGDQAEKPAALSFAPVGADLVLETKLNLREVERTAKKLAKSFGRKAEREVTAGLKEEVFDLGINIADFFADFTVRGTVVVWLDDEKTFQLRPGVEVPVPHFAARLENAGMVWKLVERKIGEKANREERDGEVILTPKKGPAETPFGPVLAQIVWKAETKELFFSMTAEDLAACRADGPRIGESEAFLKATREFPDELNSLAYVSDDIFRLVEKLGREFSKQAAPDQQRYVAQVLPLLAKLGTEGGYAAGIAIQEEGFLAVANLPFPVKGQSFLGGPSGLAGYAVLAGLATPAILKAKNKSDEVKLAADLKSLGILLLDYNKNFEEFPTKLIDLVGENLVSKAEWSDRDFSEVTYLPGALLERHKADRILAYRALKRGGKVVYLLMDGSVHVSSTEPFQRMLKRQK